MLSRYSNHASASSISSSSSASDLGGGTFSTFATPRHRTSPGRHREQGSPMSDDRYERGRERLLQLAGERGESVMAALEVSPISPAT